jgi:hypothetical protein
MDLDRVIGIVFGLLILVAIFLLPFGSFRLPSGQPSGVTFLDTIRRLVEDIISGAPHTDILLIYDIMVVMSFICLVIAGALGFYPMRSGIMGILGMVLITVLSMFNPQLGFNIPSYGAGFFAAWAFSIATVIIGKLQPQMRRKLSFLSSQAPPEKVVEQPAEKVSPPTELFRSLSVQQEPEVPTPSETPKLETPPMELFSSFSATEEYRPQPVISLPSPPVDVNVIDEEINRIRVFLVILGEERNNRMISEEAYERLKARLERMLEELTEERERAIGIS